MERDSRVVRVDCRVERRCWWSFWRVWWDWDWWVRWVFSCASSDFSFFTVSDSLAGGPAFVVVEEVGGLVLVVLLLPVPLPLLVLPLLLGAVLGLLLLGGPAGCKIDG